MSDDEPRWFGDEIDLFVEREPVGVITEIDATIEPGPVEGLSVDVEGCDEQLQSFVESIVDRMVEDMPPEELERLCYGTFGPTEVVGYDADAGKLFSAKDPEDSTTNHGYDNIPTGYSGGMVPGGSLPVDDDDVEPAITEHKPVDEDDEEKEPTHACPVCEYGEHIRTPYSTVDYWCLACDDIRKFHRIEDS